MKIKSILIAFIGLTIFFTSCSKMMNCVTPSGEVTQEEKAFTNFSELDVQDAFQVYVTFSESEESVRVEANRNLHTHIQISQYNDRLTVQLANNLNIKGDVTLKLHITMKELTDVVASGATHVKLQNQLIGEHLNMDLHGASSLNGDMLVNSLYSNISGSSNISISGNANAFELVASGASNMDGYDFETSAFTADLEGACNARLTIQESINIRAEGASNLYYKGDAVVRSQDLSGASNIIKVN